MKTTFFSVVALLFMLTSLLFAQGIHIRTVPVIAANQNQFHPSFARGMGNLSIAFDDPLGGPFINPARTARLQQPTIFSSPTLTGWSNGEGRRVDTPVGSSKYPGTSMNSIPFGGFFRIGELFAGGMIAYQGYFAKRSTSTSWGFSSEKTRRDIASNAYLFGLFGARFPESNVSVAGSVSWADYGAIDGVNLLYPGSEDIKQSGRSLEAKLGVVAELTEVDQLEFLAARNTFKAEHEVTYRSSWWPILPPEPVASRTELNRDESNGWVLHGAYKRQVDEQWKIGGILTVNWKDHPKIPNYDLANIPRDPGTSIAYNLGVGAARYQDSVTWGFEYIYEPITSYTWAEAGEGGGGPSLPPNFKTVENFFDFSNHIIRVGLHSRSGSGWLEHRLGAQLHFYSYDLEQHDNLRQTSRSASHDWLETTLSGGFNLKFSNLELMYTLQVVLGNGLVGTDRATTTTPGFTARDNDFLVAPAGNLVVENITLLTHQLTFVYRMR